MSELSSNAQTVLDAAFEIVKNDLRPVSHAVMTRCADENGEVDATAYGLALGIELANFALGIVVSSASRPDGLTGEEIRKARHLFEEIAGASFDQMLGSVLDLGNPVEIEAATEA